MDHTVKQQNAPGELVGRRRSGDEGALVVAVEVDLLCEVLVGDEGPLELLGEKSRGSGPRSVE